MTKEKLAEQYASQFSWAEDSDAYTAFLEGYEAAQPKWKKVEEYTPEEDVQVLCCLLNKWAKEVSKYSVLRYFQNNWYGDITEDEVVEKFMEIPQ